MKFLEAKEIGEECGLEHPAEWVNNIFIHSIFEYSEIEVEEKELKEDAIKHGVKFSTLCGHAVLDDNVDELCYMCKKILKLEEDERYKKEAEDDKEKS